MKKITQMWMCIAFLCSSTLLFAQNEGSGDFPNSGTGPTFNLATGANGFSGNVSTPSDGQDRFQIVLANGQSITSISTSATGGGATGFFQVGNELVNFPGGNITPVPSSPGTYNVLVVTNFSTGTNWSMTVNVSGSSTTPPAAAFSTSPTGGCSIPHTVFFTDQSTSNTTSWSWTFGDGGTSTAKNPIHNYTAAGEYTVTLTASNSGGSDSATKTIQVSSPLNASISSQTNVSCNGGSDGSATVTASGGRAPYFYSWVPSGGNNATATGLSADTYTVIITDVNGCTDTASVTIMEPRALETTITSSTDASCPSSSDGSATVLANGGAPGYTYSWAPSGGNNATATGLSAGTYTATVTDSNGCSDSSTVIIEGIDSTAPTANCVAPFTVQLDANGQASIAATDIENGSTDNCGIAAISIDVTDFDCSNIGDNTITLTVTDTSGNSSTCTTTVTVEDSIDPIISCLENIVVNTNPGDCFATVNFSNALAIDNCSVVSVVQTDGLPSGSQFPVGVSTVEFTATDTSGNTSICTFDITVEDNEAPLAVCENITIQLDEFGSASITAAELDGGSTDACGVDTIAIDQNTFDCSNVGDNNVTLTVTDVNGNSSTCTAIVTVEDVTAPEVVCQDITVQLDASGSVSITGMDVDGGSTDACGIASYDLDVNTFDCSNVGVNAVELTVTDNNGNTATCTAMVTVEDNIAPDLVCEDFTLELGEDGTATLLPGDVIATNDDACGIETSAVDITQFDCSDIGTPVTVQVFVSDVNGNLSTCNAVVTVVDTVAPIISCPEDQTVDPGPGSLFYEVPDYFALGEASVTDNCTNNVTITSQQPAAGEVLSDGVHTITLTAEDDYGNIGTCTFELTVESVLGVGTTESLGNVQLYPNPAKNQVTLGNPSQENLKEAIIYDLTGRVIHTINLNGMGTQKTIDVTDLASATYMVRISSENGTITKQLIKK